MDTVIEGEAFSLSKLIAKRKRTKTIHRKLELSHLTLQGGKTLYIDGRLQEVINSAESLDDTFLKQALATMHKSFIVGSEMDLRSPAISIPAVVFSEQWDNDRLFVVALPDSRNQLDDPLASLVGDLTRLEDPVNKLGWQTGLGDEFGDYMHLGRTIAEVTKNLHEIFGKDFNAVFEDFHNSFDGPEFVDPRVEAGYRQDGDDEPADAGAGGTTTSLPGGAGTEDPPSPEEHANMALASALFASAAFIMALSISGPLGKFAAGVFTVASLASATAAALQSEKHTPNPEDDTSSDPNRPDVTKFTGYVHIANQQAPVEGEWSAGKSRG